MIGAALAALLLLAFVLGFRPAARTSPLLLDWLADFPMMAEGIDHPS